MVILRSLSKNTTHQLVSLKMRDQSTRKFSCGVELALDILSGKWKPVILAHLKEGPMRYSQLRALIPALSDKMLTQRLQDLEALGLVSRQKQGRRGARAVYQLTDRVASLRPALQALQEWGVKIAEEVGAVIEPLWELNAKTN
jgi:DNA-binding HxlR family transcriptional regulator